VVVTNPKMKAESQRIPDELVDAFFDRELDEGSREKFFGMLRGDLSRCAEVARTQRMISVLREPVEGPDLTAAIMGQVSRRRGFLPERLRRMVKAGRLAAAACVLLALLGVAVVHRLAPEAVELTERPRPVTQVVTSGAQEATAGVQNLAEAVGAVKARIAEPAAELGRLLWADDLPEVESGEVPSARVYLVGGVDGDTSAPSLESLVEPGAMNIVRGAGGEVPFVVPTVVYVDGSQTRVVMRASAPPSGRATPWVGQWRENIFLLQPVEEVASGEQ
jgi:hypothetical protein